MPRLLILNPNSSVAMTRDMCLAIEPWAARHGHSLSAERIAAAPAGIESDADVAFVAPLVAERAATADHDALIVACFSDPGADAARKARPDLPVIGIAEAAYYTALPLADRFGVISLSPSSIARHARRIAALGLTGRLAGDRAIHMSVAEAADPVLARQKVIEIGRELRDLDGAGAVILGCAGMGLHRAAVQDALGLPVIDPVQAACLMAVTMLELKSGSAQ